MKWVIHFFVYNDGLHKLFQRARLTTKQGGKITNHSLILILFLITSITVPALGQLNGTEWFDIGLTLYNQDRYNDSIKAYDKVIEINPQNAVAWNNKGIDLGMLGEYEEALKAFDRAAMINSSYAEPWYNMGVIHDLQRNYTSAIQDYTIATQINPSYRKALVNKNNDIDIISEKWPDWNQF